MAKKPSESSKTIDGLNAKVAELEAQAAELQKRISELTKEIVELKDAAAKAASVPPPPQDVPRNQTVWEKFKKWFS